MNSKSEGNAKTARGANGKFVSKTKESEKDSQLKSDTEKETKYRDTEEAMRFLVELMNEVSLARYQKAVGDMIGAFKGVVDEFSTLTARTATELTMAKNGIVRWRKRAVWMATVAGACGLVAGAVISQLARM